MTPFVSKHGGTGRLFLTAAATIFAFAIAATAQSPAGPVRQVSDPGVVTTRQAITPAGVQNVFDGRVYGITFGPADDTVYVTASSGRVYKLNWQTNRVLQVARDKNQGTPGIQGITIDPASGEPLVTLSAVDRTGQGADPVVRLVRVSGGTASTIADHLGTFAVGALSVAGDKAMMGARTAVVALTFDDAVAVIDLASGKSRGTIRTGIAPFGTAINKAGTAAYVSNWGGRFSGAGDVTSTTGNKPNADHVVVDKRGIASTGTVTRVDLVEMKRFSEIPVGLHPTALVWDEARSRLYVTNSNSDSVSVINTDTNAVVRTISLQPFDRAVPGVAPNAVAVSMDGETLYVACGGVNAIAVIRTSDGQTEGMIPTAWYPSDLRLSADGKYLAVSNLMGVGSGGAPGDIERMAKNDQIMVQPGPTRRYVHSDRSSIQVMAVPDANQLAGYTTAVAENNHLPLRAAAQPTAVTSDPPASPLPVPLKAGDPSAIDHVVYIIKENRTYDQLFGDLAQANSDPTLLVYGRDVTPNQHRLAEQFVVLDNFYAAGGNSADGHQWVTQAAETDYCYWPGYEGRSYPFEGSDPIAPASGGFIWDAALGRERTVEDFGEYVGTPANSMRDEERIGMLAEWKNGADFSTRFHTVAPIAPLNKVLAKDYPYWTMAVPDVVRAQIFLKHLQGWESDGQMPNLVLVQLPSDHTRGTTPGISTPKATVADNDLALGQIVEGLTKSPFWKSMAIFIVEDDAQNGIDHVDGHRTVALAVSPYIRRGSVDSTFYSHPSMLKTMELMLGLPTLSLFDMIANDMRNSFQAKPDFTPYSAVVPKQSLFEVNPPASALKGPAREGALASMKMNFAVPDAAPTEILNRILWHDARGWTSPYPQVKQAVFAPYSVDLTDDDKEEAARSERK